MTKESEVSGHSSAKQVFRHSGKRSRSVKPRGTKNTNSSIGSGVDPEPNKIAERSTNSETGCFVCGVDDDYTKLLLCEACNGEYHTYCLTPRLNAVPDGAWYCDNCKLDDDGDGLAEMVAALPPEITSRYGEIVWSQGGVGYGWWPSCIYDPRLTVGGARAEAKKKLGKQHLVYFFCCFETPFAVLPDARIMNWEEGIMQNYHLGKAAKSTGKQRYYLFHEALQAAIVEASKPVERRLDWNHQGANIGPDGQPIVALQVPNAKKRRVRMPRKKLSPSTKFKTQRKTARRTSLKKTPSTIVGSDSPITSDGLSLCNLNVGVSSEKRLSEITRSTAKAHETPKVSVRSDGLVPPDANLPLHEAITVAHLHAASVQNFVLTAPVEVGENGNHLNISRSGCFAVGDAARSSDRSKTLSNSVDHEMVCKIERHAPADQQLREQMNIGFVIVPFSSTFVDVRNAINTEIEPASIPECWRFIIPGLGPVSLQQESKFGAVYQFLKKVAQDCTDSIGEGTFQNPIKMLIVESTI